MGLEEEPAPVARVALVAEESWQKPLSKMISAATLAVQPADTDRLARVNKGALLSIEWPPECAFPVKIMRLPPRPNRNQQYHETDFTG